MTRGNITNEQYKQFAIDNDFSRVDEGMAGDYYLRVFRDGTLCMISTEHCDYQNQVLLCVCDADREVSHSVDYSHLHELQSAMTQQEDDHDDLDSYNADALIELLKNENELQSDTQTIEIISAKIVSCVQDYSENAHEYTVAHDENRKVFCDTMAQIAKALETIAL